MALIDTLKQLNISFIDKGFDKNGQPLNASNGDKMEIISLGKFLCEARKHTTNTRKGEYGQIYALEMDTNIPIDEIRKKHILSSGVMFLDIDHLTDEQMKTINNKWIDICGILPNMLAMLSSYSNTGMHIFVWTDKLNWRQYEETYCNMMSLLLDTLKTECGIELTKHNIDLHNANIKQKFYVSASKYTQYNPLPRMIDLGAPSMVSRLKELREKYTFCYNTAYRDELVSDDYDVKTFSREWDFDIFKREFEPGHIVDYLPHRRASNDDIGGRMELYSSLQYVYGEKDVVDKEWLRCARMIPDKSHGGEHDTEFYETEPDRNNWFTRNIRRMNAGQNLGCNSELLKEFGYEIIWIKPKTKTDTEESNWIMDIL